MTPVADASVKRPLWQDHLGLLTSAALAGFVILRLLGVANWDITTALGIAATAGTASVALNGFLASFPTIYAAVFMAALPTLMVRLAGRSKVERSAALMAASFPLLLLLYLAPLVTLSVGLVGLALLWLLIKRTAAKRKKLKASGRAVPKLDPTSQFERTAAMIGSGVILLSLTISTPWLPPERLIIAGGEAFTGYVVGSRDQDTVVLRDARRVLEVVPTAELDRSFCAKDLVWSKTAMQLVAPPRYPTCP